MDVKQGYKQTEVGVIPEDWEVTTVADQFSIQLGKMLDSEKNIGVLKPYLGNRAVQWGRIEINDISYIKLSASDLKRYRIEKGDLLVCEGGEIGRAAIWNELIEECYYQKALHRLRPISDYNVRFMLSVLEWLASSGLLEHFVTQTSIAHLPKERFEIVPIPLPPKAEQEAIAEALNDADAFIESLEQLIAKKRQMKQGAMQELLTGKKRLPGFSESWKSFRLGDHLIFLANGVNSRAELTVNDSVRYLHYGDIHGSESPRMSPANLPTLPTEKAKSLSRLCNGDLVFADASEDVIGVGKSVEIVDADNFELVSGLHTIVVRFDKSVLADGFKAYLQFCPDFSKQLRQLAAGTKVYATNRRHIADMEMDLPSVVEQATIVSVLSDMDAEIDMLESKLVKARWIKQGMMHNLLTGKIRLV